MYTGTIRPVGDEAASGLFRAEHLARPQAEPCHRLWSLWAVMDFYARDFVEAIQNIELLQRISIQWGETNPDDPIKFDHVDEHIIALMQHLSAIDLPVSIAQVERIVRELQDEKYPTSGKQFGRLLRDLGQRIDDEMRARVFFCVTPDYTRRFFYADQPLLKHRMALRPLREIYGDATMSTFFSTDEHDPIEAVKCLTRGCSTATVFHLMRMLEIGLTPFGALFGVSLDHTNWGPALEKIESKIKEMHKDPLWKALPDCKDRQEAYGQVASSFDMFRVAWRNYTVHNRGKYTEDEADDIFRSVKTFLNKAADVLQRYPNPTATP
jgi:hypothetical protein